MSGADFLGDKAHQTAGEDRDEGDLDESDEVPLGSLDDRVQPAMARHCRPQKQTHQIAMVALRSAAPVSAGFGPERVGRVPAMAASSARTSSTKASTSAKASHEAGEVVAVLTAVPIGCWLGDCW